MNQFDLLPEETKKNFLALTYQIAQQTKEALIKEISVKLKIPEIKIRAAIRQTDTGINDLYEKNQLTQEGMIDVFNNIDSYLSN